MACDRTSEFMATIKSMANRPQYLAAQTNGIQMELRARKGTLTVIANDGSSTKSSSPLLNPHSSQYSQFARFMAGSRSVARDLYHTFQKLEKINLLAQKKTIFDDDDVSKELNELVYIVKQDITSLNQQIEQLRQQQIDSMQARSSGGSNVKSHTKNVVLTLQQQLASISNSFKSTLELRTQVLYYIILNQFKFNLISIYLFLTEYEKTKTTSRTIYKCTNNRHTIDGTKCWAFFYSFYITTFSFHFVTFYCDQSGRCRSKFFFKSDPRSSAQQFCHHTDANIVTV